LFIAAARAQAFELISFCLFNASSIPAKSTLFGIAAVIFGVTIPGICAFAAGTPENNCCGACVPIIVIAISLHFHSC
jgi:hypothetical protein